MKLSATRWTLIQAAQDGDEGAVARLCEKYRPAVVAYLTRRGLGDQAEDVAQEVLVGLVGAALGRVERSRGRFRGLVFALARNQMAKHLERRNAAKRGGGRVQHLGDIEVAAEEPDDDFDREWLANVVQNALGRLAADHPVYFEALERFVLRGQSQAEIAQALGTSVGVIKKRVFRGKKKLSGYLRDEVWRYSSSANEYEAELKALAELLED